MKNKNILLLAMSTLPRDIGKDNYYWYQNEDGEIEMEAFAARSQLEPVTHMLSNKLGKKKEKLDKVIILETEATSSIIDGKITAVDFYKERVSLFAQEIKYIDIPINEDELAEGIKEATDKILQEYEKCLKNNVKMKLWIDTQGGFRDVVMVFTAIISLLREQGIEAEGIYSVRFSANNAKQNPCPIINQTKKYDIFKFVSAMQEFMDFGKATGFKKYYGEENSFVQAIDKIADAIQMCQPQMFGDAIQGLAAYLKSEQDKIGDPYLRIFVDFIKKDYSYLLENPDDTIAQIKWCVRKEFYQQAMTIYTEKMPKYYFEKGILKLDVDFEQKLNYGKTLYVDAFYTNMFEVMLKKTDDIFNNIISALSKDTDWNEERNVLKHLRAKLEKTENGLVSKAISRLMEYLERKYGQDGKLLEKQLEGEAKTVQKYIGTLCNDKGERNKFLYGCNPKKKETYTKKVFAIKAAKEIDSKIAKIMEYYLAIKLLRNRMNHANDEESEQDEKNAIKFLKEDGIDIGIMPDESRLNFQEVKKLILDGIGCSN